MPYITKDNRKILDYHLDALIDDINSHFLLDDREGILNYTISRLVASCMKPKSGWRYSNLARARAVFTEAGAEFTRRLIRPYEDEAIEKNGDIPEYE